MSWASTGRMLPNRSCEMAPPEQAHGSHENHLAIYARGLTNLNLQLTLGRLVEQLGSGVLDVLVAPAGLDVAVGHAAIHDPTEPPRAESRDVILAVAVRPEDPAADELVRLAGAAGATAVVFKTREPAPLELLHAAEAAGVALLAAPPEITWSQLHALMRTAIASPGYDSDPGTGQHSSAHQSDLYARRRDRRDLSKRFRRSFQCQ